MNELHESLPATDMAEKPAHRQAFPGPSGARPSLGPDFAAGSPRIRKLSEGQRKVRDSILRSDSPADYEAVRCPCGSQGGDELLATVERHGLECSNVVCLQCGLVRITPRWTESRYQRFYETEYRDLYNRIDVSKEAFARTTAGSGNVRDFGAWVVKVLERQGKAGAELTVLEIGAGAGWNLANLPAAWKRIGYDVDKEYLGLGASLFGLEMRFGLLEEALAAIPGADVVILSHVLEHFMDPNAALLSIARKLKPEALLLIEVPGLFRIHRSARDPMTFLQNAHTFTFSAGTLNAACARSSLRVIESDEMCRAVCAPAPAPQPVADDRSLAAATSGYLKRCAQGCATEELLRRIPVLGRYLAGAWRRGYFPLLKSLVPSRSARSGK